MEHKKSVNDPLVLKFPDEAKAVMQGAIDTHCHAGPSLIPRKIDAVSAARQAADAGLVGVVIKDHHLPSARDVMYVKQYILDKDFPVDVIGTVALNAQVGGVNPHTAEAALFFGAKIVYLPTFSSLAHKEHHAKPAKGAHFPATAKKLLPSDPLYLLDQNGKLDPAVGTVIELVRDAGAVLATGHLSVKEIMAVLGLAQDMGLKRIMINHPNYITEASDDEILAFVAKGATIEFSASMTDPRSKFYFMPPAEMHRLIFLMGLDNAMVGSDLGQHDTPPFVEGLMKVADGLLGQGMTIDELGVLFGGNARKLLY